MRLEVEQICVNRGGRPVLDGLSFTLEPGQALIVTGPNGAGKSTLLRALAGLLPLTAGEIRVRGLAEATLCRETAHYIGHADGNKASLTPRENLAFWRSLLRRRDGHLRGLEPADALACFGLGHVADLPFAVLSAGQKRRVALARLLVAPRPVWLLDEPTTALDAAAQERLGERMRSHLGEGGIIVSATHGALDLPDATRLALRH